MAASGVSDIVRHGHEGLLARSDDGVAAHVVTLALDDAQRERDRAAQPRHAYAAFDWPRVIDAHIALYREAIALRESV